MQNRSKKRINLVIVKLFETIKVEKIAFKQWFFSTFSMEGKIPLQQFIEISKHW